MLRDVGSPSEASTDDGDTIAARAPLAPIARARREPTSADYERLLQLSGEVLEIADPADRRRHALTEYARLIGSRAVVTLRSRNDADGRARSAIDGEAIGLDGNEVRFFTCDFYSGDPVCPMRPFFVDPPRATDGTGIAYRGALTEQLLSQRSYDMDLYVNEVIRPYGLESTCISRARNERRGVDVGLADFREIGDRPMGGREAAIHRLFHANLLARLYPQSNADADAALRATPADPVESLPPRLKPVLRLLLDGDAEKQVAAKLGLSPHTVHQYVKVLYKTLGVSSRAELLARCLKPAE